MEHAQDRLPLVLDRSRMAGAPGLIAFDGGAQHLLQIGLVVPLDRVVETLERRDQLGVSRHRLEFLKMRGWLVPVVFSPMSSSS